MDKGTRFNAGFTKSALETMGFSTCEEGYHGFVRFTFFGKVYEIVRYRNCACIGTWLDVTSDPEFVTYMEAGEEVMETRPDVQCFFSAGENAFRVRLWGRCSCIEEFSRFVREGISGLDDVREVLYEKMLGLVYLGVKTQIDDILSSRTPS